MALKQMNLRTQLLVFMTLMTAVPLIILTVFGNFFYARGMDEQATAFTEEMLSEVHNNIDASVNAAGKVLTYLAQDENVIAFLRLSGTYDAGRIEAETGSRNRMRLYREDNDELLSGILIAGENGLYASNELYRVTRKPLTEESWYRATIAARGQLVLLPRPIGRNIGTYHSDSVNDIVMASRAVLDPESGELLGVIICDMPTRVMEERISAITLAKSGYVYIADAQGQIVYSPVNDTVYRIEPAWLREAPTVRTVLGQRWQLLRSHSDVTGWDTVGVFRMDTALARVVMLRRYMLILALASLLIALVLSVRFSSSFIEPIAKLGRLMGEAEKGTLSVSFDASGYSMEIRQLARSFNSMMERIRGLIDLVYRQQRAKRRAEMSALQAQINPHFLYNTLDTIRWMAEEHQAPEIVHLVSALTRLFRISLSRGKSIITVAEEVEHVRNYLYIQKVRYEDKLEYVIDVPDDIGAYRVPKLVLQPIVENAIYHGIKEKRGTGHIALSGREEGERLLFTVADDGAGMPREKLEALNATLAQPAQDLPTDGYGIYNVNNRIRLTWDEGCGLKYALNEAGGVTVTLCMRATLRDDPQDMREEGAGNGTTPVEDPRRGR